MGFEHAIRASQGARNYQEDAAAVKQDATGMIAVLADGMGGHAGGAVASDLATASFITGFIRAAGDVEARLLEALEDANAAIAYKTLEAPDLSGMGCTLVGVAFAPEGIDWISVGDSPLYLLREGRIARLNQDHSFAPEIDRLAEIGRISWEEARAHPHRHVLRSAITGTEIDLLDCSQAPLAIQAGDVLILASDGIHTISEAEIERIVGAAATPHEAAEGLLAAVAAANHPHQDNTTLVVVRITP
ncbi:MAG TPA: protein phosphatase 2C domain-containing protein [Hyphomicrobiaceae bacterium]|nr:protein phosphatase 2C domain-containing protein [Hyphomicrobiaceae bacterium]